jgi:hypothetical protein
MNYIFLTQRNSPAAVCINEGFSLNSKSPDEAEGEMTAILLLNFINHTLKVRIYKVLKKSSKIAWIHLEKGKKKQ